MQRVHLRSAAALILVCVVTIPAATGGPESLPNPYHLVKDYFQMPTGRKWGQVASVDVDPKGNIWIFERCGDRACNNSAEDGSEYCAEHKNGKQQK